MTHVIRRAFLVTGALLLLSTILPAAALAESPEPFRCFSADQGLIAEDLNCRLFTDSAFPWPELCPPMDAEMNAMGFRSTDGMLYGLQLFSLAVDGFKGNGGILRIGGNCAVEHLGVLGLPEDERFFAGDISTDGTTMYINHNGKSPLYIIDLRPLDANPMAQLIAEPAKIWGDTGLVVDWAYNPVDGLLYGGDSTDGELAILNPRTGERVDVSVLGMPPGGPGGYGGARFNADGYLVLYRHFCHVIDVVSRELVDFADARSSPWIDAASCGCDDAFFMQDDTCLLFRSKPSSQPFSTPAQQICGPEAGEINNMGFRYADAMLYGVELTRFGNKGLVKLDPVTCDITPLGQAGLPTNRRFDAGDVSHDGRWLYVNDAGMKQFFYKVDLTATPPTSTKLDLAMRTQPFGYVHDWAYNPVDGNLYGGNDGMYAHEANGKLAIIDLDPALPRPERIDVALIDTGLGLLPAGMAFGGAWFDAEGHLVLHRNQTDPADGFNLYTIDVRVPTIVAVGTARGSSYNDGASCVPVAQRLHLPTFAPRPDPSW